MFYMKKQVKKAFGKNVYLLGADREGTYYWLEEATWDCGWYWGAGYVETYTNNKRPDISRDINSHQHFDGLFFNGQKMCKDMFDDFFVETPLNDSEKWKLLELMKTIYTLKKYSEVIHIGGSYVTDNPLKEVIKNQEEYNRINKIVLPQLFEKVYKILSE